MPQHLQVQSPANAKESRTNPASAVERVLDKPGTRLPLDLQMEARRRLGFDASTVCVHADADAGASARGMRMRAYAVRPHMVFAPNTYRPDSPKGRALALHELGHMKQQAEFVPEKAIAISRSAVHEGNANQLWMGQTRTVMPMAANMVAGEADTVSETAEEIAARRAGLRDLINDYEAGAPRRSGVLEDGSAFRVLANGNVEVTFRPSSTGQLIVRDADDPEDLLSKSADGGRRTPTPTLPSVRLPTGELAVQRETKQLVAYDTQVVAVYEAKNIQLDRSGVPIGIKNYKPIEVNAQTGDVGRLVATESNTTRVGKADPKGQDVIDPRLQKQTDTTKTYRGTFKQTKGPADFGGRTFNKYENARIVGTKEEEVRTRINDFANKRQSDSTSRQTFEGTNTSGKGKANKKDPLDVDSGDYVIQSNSSGKTNQFGTRVDTQILPTNRILVVTTQDDKNSNLKKNDKDLVNEGIEFQALSQVDTKKKQGRENAGRTTRSVVYAIVPQKAKTPDGKTETADRLVPVQENRSYNKTYGFGRFAQTTKDTPDANLDTIENNLARKKEEGSQFGGSVTNTAALDRGRGVRRLNIGSEGKLGVESRRKETRSPEIPEAGTTPVQGRADIASVKLLDIGKKDGKDPRFLTVGANVTSAGASLDAKGAYSYNYEKKDDDEKDTKKNPPSSWLGIFSLQTLYGATSLAGGVLLEGSASLKAEKGTKGAGRKGAEFGASVEGSIQAGYYEERRVRYIIKPDVEKIPNQSVKFVVRSIDPTLDLTFNAHAFAGVEGKANLSFRKGGDSQSPVGGGASVFAGGRAGLGIDGKLKAGRSLNSQGSDLGTLKGEVDVTAGVGAAWKLNTSASGSKLTIAGEGALTGLLGGRINARGEFDLFKFANVGYAVASDLIYGGDNRAREAITNGAHKSAGLGDRVRLIRALLLGRTDDAEQDAIIMVLEDAQSRGDLAALVDNVGFRLLRFKLDGKRNDRFHELVGR